MSTVSVVAEPSLDGMRLAFVLAEDRLGHYPEFSAFFAQTFGLDRVGLARPGFLCAPSGTIYALVFIGRSGEAFPSGVEIYAVVSALEPIDETAVDRDLRSIMGWMIEGIGGEWIREALQATGRLFHIPPAERG